MSFERIVIERVVTRGYELGHDATLPLSAYMRYLEHMRWRTGGRLHDRGGDGVVRAQCLELHASLGPEVELELSAWISRVGRTSVAMSHDIVRVDDGALIARASATLVALDGARRPTPYPDAERIEVLERPTAEVQPPGSSAGPTSAFRCPVELRRSDHDNQQHVNQARYGDLIEDVRWRCVDAAGYGPGDWGRPLRRFALAHDREMRAGDALEARTWRDGDALCFRLERGRDDVVARARMEL